jgi:hypothetical protein
MFIRLGRLPQDPAALASARAHRFGAIPPPPCLDRHCIDYQPQLYSNDTLPDCTAVALANAARGVAALNGYDLVIDPPSVPAFYAGCVGDPPNLAATDGAVMLDVLKRQLGLGFDVGPQRLYGLHATVATNRSTLASALARLGPGYWGVDLRERDMDTVGGTWDIAPGRDDGAIAGGHALIGWDYTGLGDGDTVRLGTWGAWQSATWAWVASRLQEAHGIVWRQLERADGTFYAGITADGLVAEL